MSKYNSDTQSRYRQRRKVRGKVTINRTLDRDLAEKAHDYIDGLVSSREPYGDDTALHMLYKMRLRLQRALRSPKLSSAEREQVRKDLDIANTKIDTRYSEVLAARVAAKSDNDQTY